MDKAKARWYEEGDSNTRYFHLTTIIHRSHNSINRIQLSNSVWTNKREEIGVAFVEYFKSLFATVKPQFPDDVQNLFQPVVSTETNQELMATPEPAEIKRALFSMGSYKSPGPDGLTVTF